MEKQIEEMAKELDICHYIAAPIGQEKHDGSMKIAGYLYNAGYRRASDVAREIFAEIEETIKKAIRVCDRYAVIPMLREAKMGCYKDLLGYIEKLKKKYESEGKKDNGNDNK